MISPSQRFFVANVFAMIIFDSIAKNSQLSCCKIAVTFLAKTRKRFYQYNLLLYFTPRGSPHSKLWQCQSVSLIPTVSLFKKKDTRCIATPPWYTVSHTSFRHPWPPTYLKDPPYLEKIPAWSTHPPTRERLASPPEFVSPTLPGCKTKDPWPLVFTPPHELIK